MYTSSFYLQAFGCQMNVYDAECLTEILTGFGWQEAAKEQADVIILLGCSVRARAENRLWGNVTQLKVWKEEKPGRLLALGGCTGEREAGKLLERFPHLDVVFGTVSLSRVPELLTRAMRGERLAVVEGYDYDAAGVVSPVCAFVAVTRGCNNHCAYCVVPSARGAERSRSAKSILQEVESRLAAGTKEITLVGQNVNSYLHDGLDFAGLLEQVAKLDVPRIRFTTNHPKDFSPDLAKVMAELPNVCSALHLPAQSGSDSVLERMGRGYTNSQYRAKVVMARKTVPGLGLTTDLMVGFPGESEDDFSDTLRLVEDIRFDSAFLFNYNQRPGTRAAEWNDDVPPAVKQARLQVLIDRQAEITREINRSMVGRVEEVLVEGRARKEGLRGKLRRGTVVNWQGEAIPGALCMVRVTAGDGHTLRGELVSTRA